MGEFEDTSGVTKLTKLETTDLTAGEGTIGADELASNAVTNVKVADDALKEAKLNGALITGSSDTTAGVLSTHAHGLGSTPTVVIITPTADGNVYKAADSDATNIYVKSDGASKAFEAYCLV